VKIIHAASGSVTESDVMLAIASKGIIIAFNAKPEPGAERLIEQEGVDLRHYSVIYNVTDDVQKALQGMLEPVYHDVTTAHAEVRQVFDIKRRGKIAGCLVQDGTIISTDLARVLRNGEFLADTKIASLRHFQNDVREVQNGQECGIILEAFDSFEPGDIIELYRRERQ
jgi:translation initiation factor IF-2